MNKLNTIPKLAAQTYDFARTTRCDSNDEADDEVVYLSTSLETADTTPIMLDSSEFFQQSKESLVFVINHFCLHRFVSLASVIFSLAAAICTFHFRQKHLVLFFL